MTDAGQDQDQDPGLFRRQRVLMENRPDGTLLLRAAEPLGMHPLTIVHSLRQWAAVGPATPLVAERSPDGAWRTVSYGEAVAAADAIGQALLDRGLGPGRPLLILSGNGVDHLLMTLGAMTAGVPAAPVSVAYSLQSKDHQRIRDIAAMITPGAVFAAGGAAFGPALAALPGVPAVTVGDLAGTIPAEAVQRAFASLTPTHTAKILFTSGSTGAPKGVLTTHGMLAANQQMIRQAWPFLAAERPVIVDWLPWSHTFGGSHNTGLVITAGGTIYVDAGRPVPALFGATLANLAEVAPTMYFNVPAGYAQLIPALTADKDLAATFFSRLRLLFNAGAALPAALRGRLAALAREVSGRDIPVTSSWGTTETAPAATSANFPYDDSRCIGTPLPGAELKLVPAAMPQGTVDTEGSRYEIRARGPMVTPGYAARPDLTAAAFDDEGYYCSGDAVSLADPADPDAGLLFRGRIAEDFKLSTGTFVRVGAVRTALLSAVPMLSDAVIAGQDRSCAAALAWLNAAEAGPLADGPAPPGEPPAGARPVPPDLARAIGAALAAHNASAGSAGRIERIVLLARPADLDAGEITDKGYVNQRQVLARYQDLIEALYADPPPPGVITAG
jgi:feruloyl-CoA synthase